MEALDPKNIRKDFPILEEEGFHFLDSAASSQKPRQVIEALRNYYETSHANVHRGAYRLSHKASEMYEASRERLARFIGAPEPESVIFTKNTTESVNLVAWTRKLEPGDEILVSRTNHHSNLVPWMMLASRSGARLRHMPLTDECRYDLSRIDECLGPRTKIVALSHMDNATGTVHDIGKIAKKTKEVGALFLVDGAQGACHMPVDVREIGCDFYALSAHKMLGPTGLGALYGRREVLEATDPFMGGGGMILRVRDDSFEPGPLPDRFEAGTPNIAGAIAFGAALDYLDRIGMENIERHERALTERSRVVQHTQRASARHGHHPGRSGSGGAGRTPLLRTAHEAAGRSRNGAGKLLSLQRRRRRGRAAFRDRKSEGGL